MAVKQDSIYNSKQEITEFNSDSYGVIEEIIFAYSDLFTKLVVNAEYKVDSGTGFLKLEIFTPAGVSQQSTAISLGSATTYTAMSELEWDTSGLTDNIYILKIYGKVDPADEGRLKYINIYQE